VCDIAESEGLASVVVTFDRHPASVVRPESAPALLTDLEQKLELLTDTGVDACLVITFDHERSTEPAAEFVYEVLVDGLQCKTVIVGEDFHFGHQRQGNVILLEEIGAEAGFEVRGLSLVGVDGQPAGDRDQVSSTAIRAALASGSVAEANRLLTRPYEVRGFVRGGDQRARGLGFRTANVAVPEEILLPADGVYAGWYERPNGDVHMAAISLGTRPTFYAEDGKLLLEAHLLDFDGDLYGERAHVKFVEVLRGQVKFDGIEALKDQLHLDIAATRRSLG
ncbi:MAG: riboflavin biosynthesis protein RibF, partial [Acidimicrobiales bacterium]|nr:riboflavin biosynthesis protein RibF [Acidimicrobiales bacterium]